MYIACTKGNISWILPREYGHVWRFAFDLFIFFLSNTRAQLCTAECHAHRAPTEAPPAAAAVDNGKRHAARSSHVEWLTAITFHSYENNLSFSTPERAAWHLAPTACTSCADCVRPRKAHFDMAMTTTTTTLLSLASRPRIADCNCNDSRSSAFQGEEMPLTDQLKVSSASTLTRRLQHVKLC